MRFAHIAARHGTREATKAEIAQLATIPLIFWGGMFGYDGNQGPTVLLPVGFVQFHRAMESEADRLAVSVTAAAGYDPEGLANYVGRVQQDPPQAALYPPRDDRVQTIERAIRALSPQTYASSGDFASIQDEVRRALPPPPPKPTLQR